MTDVFQHINGELFAENVAVSDLAEQFGTPLYIYSRKAFSDNYMAYANAFADQEALVCYATKANSNIAVLNVLAKLGAGFDIVSVGELERVLKAGGDPSKIVFSGVAKTTDEMRRALAVGVHCFNVESAAELERLNDVAIEMGLKAPISLRVNPDVDAQTHPYISTGLKENKFGVDIDVAKEVYAQAKQLPGLEIKGVDCHIGSQLTQLDPFLDALDRLLSLVDALSEQGIELEHIDLGGGLGVTYDDEVPPTPQDFADAILPKLAGRNLKIIMEPGRSIAANAGIFVTEVEFLKSNGDKNFAIIDGGMNDLIRPALYSAWQRIVEVQPRTNTDKKVYDVVGPVCETGDFLGKDRELAILPGDLLAVKSSGAYGFAMASNYNTRNKPAEIIVDGDQFHLIRRRETITDQLSAESIIAE
ncbi:MAG: diaminopimelate decarboxylase [Crocinitomicaceae bacterium]|jgi:diaminopimelate decarboxylase